MANQYKPDYPPPSYPQQAYGGPVDYPQGYAASPPPQQVWGPQGPGYAQQGPYMQPAPYGGYQQQQMYYHQQPPMGYYDRGPAGAGGAGGGICAGIMGALACCCCLDMCLLF